MERVFADSLAEELASTLDWWREAGVDCLVAEEPRQWLKAEQAETKPARLERRREMSAPAAEKGLSTSLETNGGGEPFPFQLALFQDWLRTSDSLPYASPSSPRICPAGDPASGLMILAAMPSTEDCGAGTLISGPAGRLFDRMLAAIGRDRETIYLAGLTCVRPPAGRMDAAGEARCADIARHHVALAEPKALLLLGDACSKALLGLSAAQARGRPHSIEANGRALIAVATLSPDFLLAQPARKALAWADLQLLMEVLR